MLDYLLMYIEDYQIEYLKEQFTDEIISLLEIEKDKVINKIEELKNINNELDVYNELSENIQQFI